MSEGLDRLPSYAKRMTAVAVGTVLSAFALDACFDYDDDIHPSVGVVTAKEVPYRDCYFNGKTTTCQWHNWIYVDGCRDIPADAIGRAQAKNADFKREKGWVDVTGQTWNNVEMGEIVEFKENNTIGSIKFAIPGLRPAKASKCDEH